MQRLNVNIADREMEQLERLCAELETTKTQLVREWLRGLVFDWLQAKAGQQPK